jgi:hypothetical protein
MPQLDVMRKLIQSPLTLIVLTVYSLSFGTELKDDIEIPPSPNELQEKENGLPARDPNYKGFLNLGEFDRDIQKVSMIELIARPEKFHKKKIMVLGYYRPIGGFPFLFFTKEHHDLLDISNAVQLEGELSQFETIYPYISQGSLEDNEPLLLGVQGLFNYYGDVEIVGFYRKSSIEVTLIKE